MNLLDNQRAAESIDGLYMDLEARLMQNIIRHIKDYDQPIPTDEWLLQKLAEIGKLNRENIRIISQMAGISSTAAQRMLEDMAEQVIGELEPGFKHIGRSGLAGEAVSASKSRNVKQAMRALQKQAKDTLNLCNTNMLYKSREKYMILVQNIADRAGEILNRQDFVDLLNQGITSAVLGGQSRAQVVRQCIREFNNKGIPAFVDRRGREWTPEAYVNMAMRTTYGSVANEIQMARCDDHGIDLIEIDSHPGARPKCARDQGKVFDRANKSDKYPHWNTSSYGEPDGILGINCGHHGYPYIEGVHIRRYFPTEDLEANDRLYKQIQKQRAFERDVRKQKRECMLYDSLGDKEGFEQAAVKLKSKEAAFKYFVDGNDQLHRRKDREQVVGFDKRISAEAVRKAQKHYKEWSKSVGVESGPKTLAGYYDLKYNDSKESRLYKGYVRAINQGNISPLVGYDKFNAVAGDIEKRFVGMKTADGLEIKGYTAHFVDRVIGQQSPDSPARKGVRNGVGYADIEDALKNPKKIGPVVEKDNGNRSKIYFGNNAAVSYNPDTQELIQIQPKRTK